jgi:hypothetical protein
MPTGTQSVSNDPAFRTLPIYIGGNALAPLDLTIKLAQADSRLVLALISGAGAVDYLNTRHVFQCESATLGTDTASAADANASGGTVAETTSWIINNLTVERLTIDLTDKLDAFRGQVDVWLRARSTVASTPFELQAKYGTSGLVSHSLSSKTYTLGTNFEDIYLGRVHVEPVGPVALSLFLYARRVSGTGNLRWDALSFVPVQQIAQVSVSGAGASGDYWHFNAEKNTAEIVSSTGVHKLQAAVAGPLPFWAQPGINILYIARGYDQGAPLTNQFATRLTDGDNAPIRVRYSPRHY